MNQNQTRAVLKVLNYLGIKSHLVKNQMSKSYHIRVVYNKSGDTIPFNPYTRLGDSMRVAMLLNMKVCFGEFSALVKPSDCDKSEASMIVSYHENNETKKTYRIGNAVINCAIAIIKKDIYHEVS